jgi:hypothetical protein
VAIPVKVIRAIRSDHFGVTDTMEAWCVSMCMLMRHGGDPIDGVAGTRTAVDTQRMTSFVVECTSNADYEIGSRLAYVASLACVVYVYVCECGIVLFEAEYWYRYTAF